MCSCGINFITSGGRAALAFQTAIPSLVNEQSVRMEDFLLFLSTVKESKQKVPLAYYAR